jgi:hypothetical protein
MRLRIRLVLKVSIKKGQRSYDLRLTLRLP